MIRKNIKLKKSFYNILVITSFIVICLVFSQKIPNSSFIKYENYNIDEVISQNEKYYTKSLNNITTVLNDLLEGYTGEGYNLEEEYYSNVVSRSMDSKKQCDDHCYSHGPGHENGGINLLDTGCRNYKGWSYGNYGSLSIPIWINMTSMNTITDVTHRNTLINDIRYQISLWNSVQMHDGSGTLVYLYEVGIGENTRPNNINGKKVVEILRKDGKYSGQFDPNNLQIKINYSYSSSDDRGGRNVDTPLHEMGHLLGLMDLEADGSGIARGTHKTLMGYNRGTTINGIDKAIKYQDIQGVAVLNNIHTEHKFDRFVLKNGRYLNICFYCDRIDSTISAKSGVLEMQSETTCEHDFQPLVSCADNHWVKCTKCYKVIESDYYFNVEGTSTSRTIKILGPVNNSIQKANIPRKIIDINVTSIGAEAFKNCINLEKIIIPNTVTNIDSSAFENCSNLQSVTLPTNLVAIGSSAFKGCGSLAIISIPNGVTYIDSSVFENCSNLQSVTLPTNLVAIGSSAFKGCESLESITISNTVTNIDSSAFENCSYLESVTLSSNLNAIGVSAFKGCESLGSITIPSNVQYINDSAFENCFSLVSVIIEREISNITNLGDSAFDGCSSTLQIIVPQNRVAEYKNKEYWSDYKNRIEADDNTFVTHQLNCETNLSFNTNLESNKPKLYKIDVQSSNIYKFSFNSASLYNINLYDSNFNIVYSSQIMFHVNLIQGTYYFEIKFNDEDSTGNINTQIESTKLLYIGNNNILNRYIHNIEDYVYINNISAGFYKITLNATNSSGTIEYPEGCIKVYADEAKQQMLARLETIFYTLDAETQGDSNNIIVFLEYGESYYINIDLLNESYSSMYINVERLTNTYDIIESNTAEEHVILDENTTAYGDYIQRVEIHEAGTYTITFTHEGPQSEENLSGQEDPLYLYYAFYKEVNSPAEQFGDLEMIFPHIASSWGGTISFTFNLQPGVYYIGYYNKLNNEPMSISITS